MKSNHLCVDCRKDCDCPGLHMMTDCERCSRCRGLFKFRLLVEYRLERTPKPFQVQEPGA